MMKSYQNLPNWPSHFTTAPPPGSDSAHERDDAERDHHDERDDAEQRRVAAGPRDAGAFGAQKIPNEVSMTPTPNFNVFSGTRVSGACTITPAISTTTNAAAAPIAANPTLCCVPPNVTTMNATSRPFEEHALERDRERVPVVCRSLAVGAEQRDLGFVDRVLVVQRLQAARAQDRLAQPLQPEDQQHRADDESQRVDRQVRERGAERGDDDGERRPAAATPHPADRQPRVTPTASTIVSASTISTAHARNAATTKSALCIAPPHGTLGTAVQ